MGAGRGRSCGVFQTTYRHGFPPERAGHPWRMWAEVRHDLAYGAEVGKSRTEFRLKAERVLPSR